MKILDIPKFRELFKSHIKETQDKNRDPHFAGHSRETDQGKVFGFFDLYHGVKPDMENLLKTILDMARDSQALYEFMQNAVDAVSTDFMLFHHNHKASDQDYLVVVNNGKAFDLKGILAILNIGASNKFRDVNSIGQFGVGFKLAHRLVGEETGLKALLEENKGPILFSWQKGELSQLAEESEYQKVDLQWEGTGDNAICKSEDPWLMKILYTNFPCIPSDPIVDAQGNATSDAFSPLEQLVLREVAQRCLLEIEGYNYSKGALLLIPLHKKKITELTEDVHKYGLEISTSILNMRSGAHTPLERIVLNGHTLGKVNPNSVSLRFPADQVELMTVNGSSVFEAINILEIDLLYGDPFQEDDYFKGKPQFYLYFPMTEERHGFRFAIHCNAFSFTSARTALQENTQRNNKIFELLIEGLNAKLKDLSQQRSLEFQKLYASLILSKRGDNNQWKENRSWLEPDLWTPLMKLLNSYIPVTIKEGGWQIAEAGETVFIKNSELPLEKWTDPSKCWFYWDINDYSEIYHQAIDKLNLKPIGLLEILQDSLTITGINEWLSKDQLNRSLLLSELNNNGPHLQSDKSLAKEVWNNVAKLRLWSFGNEVFSIDELASRAELWNHLISYGPIETMPELISRAGFVLSKEKLSDYPAIEGQLRDRNQSRLNYLFNFESLILLLSKGFIAPNLYKPVEKNQILSILVKAIIDSGSTPTERIQRVRSLSLFANRRGEIRSLKSLIQREDLNGILEGWLISNEEAEVADVRQYTMSGDEEIYENVVSPMWNDIADAAAVASAESRHILFSQVRTFFSKKPTMTPLPASGIFFNSRGDKGSKNFYNPILSEIPESDYQRLETAFRKTGLGNLPQYSLLPFYTQAPFILPPVTILTPTLDPPVNINSDEAVILIQMFKNVDPSALVNCLFIENENKQLHIRESMEGIIQCHTIKPELKAYIQKWCSEKLMLLPDSLKTVSDFVELKGDAVLFKIIKDWENKDNLRDLAQLVTLTGDDEHKKSFLNKVAEVTTLNLKEPTNESSTITPVIKLCLRLTDKGEGTKLLSQLLSLEIDGEMKRLSEINNKGSDEIILLDEERPVCFSVADLLKGKHNEINQVLTQVARRWVDCYIGTLPDIETALGVNAKRSPEKVLVELLAGLKDGVLEDGLQLAYVLLMHQGHALPEGLSLQTATGFQKMKENIFYFASAELDPFIPGKLLLSKLYDSCKSKISFINNSFSIEDVTFVKSPSFVDSKFILPGIEKLEDEISQAELFSYIFRNWSGKTFASNGKLRPSDGINWHSLLGFNPHRWIVDYNWALQEEEVPFERFGGFDEDRENLTEFLVLLGARGSASPSVKWRKWFSGKGEAPEENLQGESAVLTLKWLAEKKITVVTEHLNSLYSSLGNYDINLVPVPCYSNGDLKIILPDSDNVYYVGKDQENAARDIKISLADLSRTGFKLIPPISSLTPVWGKVISKYTQLVTIWNQINWDKLRTISSDWNQPFYQQWASKYKMYIFTYPGNLPRQVIINGVVFSEFVAGDIEQDQLEQNKIYVNEELAPPVIVERLGNSSFFSPEARENLKISYAESTAKYAALFEKIQADQALANEVRQLLKKVEQQQDKREAAARLKDESYYYTMQWFKDLLNLVRIQESINTIPVIEFGGIRLLDGTKDIYELYRTGSRVAPEIETYENITATITYRTEDGLQATYNTPIEATRKNQTIWARFPEAGVQPILGHVGNIISVRLSFARVTDLIQSLKNGFETLNYPPEFSLKKSLSHNIRFIFGPPGTGKTTEIASRLLARFHGGVNKPVIVLTPTNKAADVLAHKIIKLNDNVPPTWLNRYGTCTDPQLLEANIVGNNSNTIVNANTEVLLITTVHRFTYDRVRRDQSLAEEIKLCHCPWDLVIFDEASMIPLPYITFAIHKRAQENNDTSFWIAGDPLQIPPVFDLISEDLDDVDKLQKQNIYTMVDLQSFDEAIQAQIPIYGERGQIENLKIQHRSVPVIGELFSKFQYNGNIKHSRGSSENYKPGNARILPQFFKNLGIKPITVIRYKVSEEDTIYSPKKLNNSPIHLQSALLVNEFVKRFHAEINNERHDKWGIGIISPYRSQATLIDKMIEDTIPYSERLEVNINTVHGFQGDENDLVIAVLNPGNINAGYSRFLNEAHILNVAVSRAEDYLILFIPDEDTYGLKNLPLIHESYSNSILNIIRSLPAELHAEISASFLENALMNEKRYFEKYSRTTAHLPVNVYGFSRMPYHFRISEKAVDIHWLGEVSDNGAKKEL